MRGVKGRDLVIVTTTYGKTEAIDAEHRMPRFNAGAGYGSWAGSYRITNATPIVDRALGAVFAAAPDGRVRRLDLATGRLRWTATVTKLPAREKLTSPLNLSAGREPCHDRRRHRRPAAVSGPRRHPRRALRAGSSRVWNSLCAERSELQDAASTCTASRTRRIWGGWSRGGRAVDRSTCLVATGARAHYDGSHELG